MFIFLTNHRQLSVIYLSDIHISLSDNKENDIDKSSIGEIELSLSEEIHNDLESPISESKDDQEHHTQKRNQTAWNIILLKLNIQIFT